MFECNEPNQSHMVKAVRQKWSNKLDFYLHVRVVSDKRELAPARSVHSFSTKRSLPESAPYALETVGRVVGKCELGKHRSLQNI